MPAAETPVAVIPPKSRKKRPRPTFEDGALTRIFKFPSKSYPRSTYYVTGDEIIIRIKKARKKWKLVIPKKRVVSYRTNRWFATPRWVEIELTYTQATRLGFVEPRAPAKEAVGEQPVETAAVVEAVVEGDGALAQEAVPDTDADTDTGPGEETTLELEADTDAETFAETDPDADTGTDVPDLEQSPDHMAAGSVLSPLAMDVPIAEVPAPAAPAQADTSPATGPASGAAPIAAGPELPADPAVPSPSVDTETSAAATADRAGLEQPIAVEPEPAIVTPCPVAPASDRVAAVTPPSGPFLLLPPPRPVPRLTPPRADERPAVSEAPAAVPAIRLPRPQPSRRLVGASAMALAMVLIASASVAIWGTLGGAPSDPAVEVVATAPPGPLVGHDGIVTGSIARPESGQASPPEPQPTPDVAPQAPPAAAANPVEPMAPEVSAPVAEPAAARTEPLSVPPPVAADMTPAPPPGPPVAPTAADESAPAARPGPPARPTTPPAVFAVEACGDIATAAQAITIRFDTASWSLEPGALAALDAFAERLRSCATVTVTIEGHADSDGDADRNQAISVRRAQSVREHLLQAGARPAQLSVIGYGHSRPSVPNVSAENKLRNRRAVLVVEAAG